MLYIDQNEDAKTPRQTKILDAIVSALDGDVGGQASLECRMGG